MGISAPSSLGKSSAQRRFFFNDTATTEIYTLSLHDALPISPLSQMAACACRTRRDCPRSPSGLAGPRLHWGGCDSPATKKEVRMLKIMIAVDGSEPSLDAVHHAISLVRQGLQAHFVLAHVQQEASLFELATQDSDMIAAASVDAGMHLVAPAVALVRAAGISYEVEIGLGEPAAALADRAESTGLEPLR